METFCFPAARRSSARVSENGPDLPRGPALSPLPVDQPADVDPRVLAIAVHEDIDDVCELATACVDSFVEVGIADDLDTAAGLLRDVLRELEALAALTRDLQ